MPGPDHQTSLEPQEFSDMVKAIRNIELALGRAYKTPSSSEIKNIPVVRKSIVASRPINVGEVFTEDNLTVKRPGNGISPMSWDSILGKVALRQYVQDELID